MRTKVAMMIAMAVVLVTLVGSGPALAQMIGGVIQCQTKPCEATGDHQVLFERVGDGVSDKMIAQGGHDHLDALLQGAHLLLHPRAAVDGDIRGRRREHRLRTGLRRDLTDRGAPQP